MAARPGPTGSVALIGLDRSGICVSVQAAAPGIVLGRAGDALVGFSLIEAARLEQRAQLAELIRLGLADGGVGGPLVVAFPTPSGAISVAEISCFAAWSRGGKAACVAPCPASSGDPFRSIGAIEPALFVVARDVTRCQRSEREAEMRARRAEATLARAPIGVVETTLDGTFADVNPFFAAMLGYERSELIGTSFRKITDPRDLTLNSAQRDALWRGDVECAVVEKRWLHRSGRPVWTRLFVSIERDFDDSAPYSVAVIENIDEEKKSKDAQELLIGELNHRVKNTLAIVQGFIRQILRTARDRDDIAENIENRLQSIARAHDLLTAKDWQDVDLTTVFESAVVSGFPEFSRRFVAQLPPVPLTAQQAIMLSLVFHELATNAIKHGALSSPFGEVAVAARVGERASAGTAADSVPGGWLELVWQENGGPKVSKPSRNGFGAFLIERGVAFNLDGNAKRTFCESGFRYALEFPLSRHCTPHAVGS
ncbi:MAG: HWE histidine kinase domain-containing protein [Hyphomicrobiaceae bacterium]